MKPMGLIATISVAFLTGLASGYAIAHWRTTHIWEAKVDEEIDEMQKYFEKKYEVHHEESEVSESEEIDLVGKAIEDLKRNKKDVKVGERKVDRDRPYFRYYSNGDPDTGEEGEHVDMSEEETPTTRENKTISTDDYEVVDEATFNSHQYDPKLHFTYHYDEELLVDFWNSRIDDENRHIYLGDIEFTRPEAWEDEADLYVLNHVEKLAVHVNISVLPIPDEVYERHEAYIKNNFKERSMRDSDDDE